MRTPYYFTKSYTQSLRCHFVTFGLCRFIKNTKSNQPVAGLFAGEALIEGFGCTTYNLSAVFSAIAVWNSMCNTQNQNESIHAIPIVIITRNNYSFFNKHFHHFWFFLRFFKRAWLAMVVKMFWHILHHFHFHFK